MKLKDSIEDKIIKTGVLVDERYDNFVRSTTMSEIMNASVLSLGRERTVRDALSEMLEQCVSCVVIEERALPVGILTEKDVSRIVLRGRDISTLKIEDVMSSPVRKIKLNETEYSALKIMSKNKIRRLVVVDDDNRIAGLVTHLNLDRGLERDNVQALKNAIMEREASLKENEAELNDKTICLENVLHHSTETAIVTMDLDFIVKYYNPAAEKIFDLNAKDVIGKTVMEIHEIKKIDHSRFDKVMKILRTQEEYRFSVKLNTDNGPRFITSKISHIKSAKGEMAGYIFFSQDITDNMMLENSLLDEGRAYRCLFEDSPIPICEENWAGVKIYIDRLKDSGVTDFRKYFTINPKATVDCVSEMKLVEINKAALDLYGASYKYDLKDNIKKVLYEKSYWVLMKVIIAFAEGVTKFESETVHKTLNGDEKNVSMKWVIAPGYGETFSRVIVSIVDITAQKKNEEALVRERQKARNYLDIAEVLIVAFNTQGEITLINRKGCKILGVTEDEAIGKKWFDNFVSERDRDKSRNCFNSLMSGKKNQPGHCESIINNGRSRESIIEWNSTLIKDEKGRVTGVLCSGEDVTERKITEQQIRGALEENDLLLKEIHHRVKNNLQIICSLFNLQKDSIKDRETYEMVSECQNRIRAIALVHDKLYRAESLANIDLREYINELISNLFNFYEIDPNRVRLRIDIDDILIGINSAIPCGLIVNELVSNSLQYAFPEDGRGEINIIIRLTDVNEVDIIIDDDGIGVSEDIEKESHQPLGIQIVRTLIKQLDGTINIYRQSGTKFIIKFRLKK